MFFCSILLHLVWDWSNFGQMAINDLSHSSPIWAGPNSLWAGPTLFELVKLSTSQVPTTHSQEMTSEVRRGTCLTLNEQLDSFFSSPPLLRQRCNQWAPSSREERCVLIIKEQTYNSYKISGKRPGRRSKIEKEKESIDIRTIHKTEFFNQNNLSASTKECGLDLTKV